MQSTFLGDFAGSSFGKEGEVWKNDEVNAETKNGSVKIWFVDEDVSLLGGGEKGFWKKLFG